MNRICKFQKSCLAMISISVLTGCSAITAQPEATPVAILAEAPNPEECRFLGEVAGSQGNWFTGGFTSDKNLLIGARNDLRNATNEMGGNTVHIQHVSNSGRYEASGNANTTVIGNAYYCN